METPLLLLLSAVSKIRKAIFTLWLVRSDFGPYHLAKIINDLHIPKIKTKVSAIILIDFSDTMILPFRTIYH